MEAKTRLKIIALLVFIMYALLMLTSCKTVECYQYVRTDSYVIDDTIYIPSLHMHYYNEIADSMHCIYLPEFECAVNDTLHIDLYEIKRTPKRKCL